MAGPHNVRVSKQRPADVAPPTGATTQEQLDAWIRAQGLPALVPRSRWARWLLRRTVPATVYITALFVCLGFFGPAFAIVPDGPDLWDLTWLSIITVATFALPAGVAWLVHRGVGRLSDRRATIAAAALTVIAIVAQSLFPIPPRSLEQWTYQLIPPVFLFLITALVVWSGAGALMLWAARSTMHNLRRARSLASVALPVIFGLVIFTFFSPWMWQLTDVLPWSRLAWLALTIAVIETVVLTGPANEVFDVADGDHLSLTRLQRVNVITVVVVSQLVLAGLLALLLSGLLMVLGKIAITDAAWLSMLKHPVSPLQVGATALPVSGALLKGALFLSIIASLTFVISTSGDTANRTQFLNPTLQRVRKVLAAVRVATAR